MVGDKYGDEVDMESTSFILQDADSYRGELVGRDRDWRVTEQPSPCQGLPS